MEPVGVSEQQQTDRYRAQAGASRAFWLVALITLVYVGLIVLTKGAADPEGAEARVTNSGWAGPLGGETVTTVRGPARVTSLESAPPVYLTKDSEVAISAVVRIKKEFGTGTQVANLFRRKEVVGYTYEVSAIAAPGPEALQRRATSDAITAAAQRALNLTTEASGERFNQDLARDHSRTKLQSELSPLGLSVIPTSVQVTSFKEVRSNEGEISSSTAIGLSGEVVKTATLSTFPLFSEIAVPLLVGVGLMALIWVSAGVAPGLWVLLAFVLCVPSVRRVAGRGQQLAEQHACCPDWAAVCDPTTCCLETASTGVDIVAGAASVPSCHCDGCGDCGGADCGPCDFNVDC